MNDAPPTEEKRDEEAKPPYVPSFDDNFNCFLLSLRASLTEVTPQEEAPEQKLKRLIEERRELNESIEYYLRRRRVPMIPAPISE